MLTKRQILKKKQGPRKEDEKCSKGESTVSAVKKTGGQGVMLIKGRF